MGIYPSKWKLAHVQPVLKKGDGSNPTNYRPISICSVLSKVIETIMNYQLLNYLETHKLINDRQYGFRHQRSTGDLLSLITEKWNSSIHQFGESKAVALEISKAFDTVWHEALLTKLEAYEVANSFTSWISNFLTNRSIRVVIDS